MGGARLSQLTFDQLLWLSTEIRAITAAEIPLAQGLAASAQETPGPMGKIFRELAQQLESGKSLTQAIESGNLQLPQAQAAAIQSGEAAGNLPATLDRLVDSAETLCEVRQSAMIALFYPLIIVVLAIVLALTVLHVTLLRMLGIWESHAPAYLKFVAAHHQGAAWLGALVCGALAVLAWVWHRKSRYATSLLSGRLFQFLPGTRKLRSRLASATFAENLSILIGSNVPLTRGLPLAATATGDSCLIAAAIRAAAFLEQGNTLDGEALSRLGIPASIAWPLVSAMGTKELSAQMHEVARWQQQEASYVVDWIRIYAPPICLALVGGLAVLLYSVGLFAPFIHLEAIMSHSPELLMTP